MTISNRSPGGVAEGDREGFTPRDSRDLQRDLRFARPEGLAPGRYWEVDQNRRRFDVPVGMLLNRPVVDALTSAFRTLVGEADRLFCR